MNTTNRKLSPVNVKEYARAMLRGEWMQNGETIKFDVDGKLLDGQHRLMAVVKADMSIDMAVLRGLENKAFATLDTGKKRTGGDILSIRKIRNPNAVAAAARLLFIYQTDFWTTSVGKSGRMTNVPLEDLLDSHPQFIDLSVEAMRAPLNTKLIPHSVNIFAYYMCYRTAVADARRFFMELATGRFSDDSDPIYVLRERLIETSREFVQPNSIVKLSWLILSWNAFHNGRDLDKLPRIFDATPRFRPSPFK